MSTVTSETPNASFTQSVVAGYSTHSEAESAVRRLAANGVPIQSISIIGRDFETHEDILGFYRSADAARDGAGTGAWFGGIFGLMLGAFGFFVFPVIGGLWVLGPLSGLIAGAVGGAGVGALVNSLLMLGVPKDQALKYQERLQAGEFLVVVHGASGDVARAKDELAGTGQTLLQTHVAQ